MKKLLLAVSLILIGFAANAQVGIGTETPDSSAQLDVVSSDRGILIPRVELIEKVNPDPVTNPAKSLLVFNTTTQNDVRPGFYYWYNKHWNRLMISSQSLNTTNVSFTIVSDSLSVNDSEGNSVRVALSDVAGNEVLASRIANNPTFVKELASSPPFVDSMAGIVKDKETLTTLTDNGDGTYTYTNEDGVDVIFPVSQSGSGNPNTNGLSGSAGDIYVDKSTGDIYTYNGTTWVGSTETLTGVAFDPTTGIFTYTDEDGTANTLDLGEMVPNLETTTTVTDNGDGTYTFTNEDGISTTIDVKGNETVTTLVNNGDGTYTYTSEDGTVTIIDSTSAQNAIYDNSTSGLTSTDAQGAIDELANSLQSGAGVTLVDNGDGTVTLQAADGSTLGTVNKATLTDNGDGTYTYDNSNGSPVSFSTNAKDLNYDNSTSGLAADNVQDAIDEINTALANTSDTLVDNGNGTYTHTAVDGTVVTIDANTTSVTENNGVYTFTDGADSTIETINTNADHVAYDNTTSGLTSTDAQGAIDELANSLQSGAGVTLVDNGDGTVTLQAADGSTLGTVNKATLTDNGDGTYTYDNGNGSPVSFSTNAKDLNYDNTNSGLAANNVQDAIDEINTTLGNTSDTLVDNGNGTYTHTAVDGTKVTIDTVNSANSIYDNSTSGLAADNVQDAIDEINHTLANTSDTLSIADGHATHIAVDGTKAEFDVTQSGVGDPNGNGTTGAAGDVYVDESTGDIYTYNSHTNSWELAAGVEKGNLTAATGDRVKITNGQDAVLKDVTLDVNEANLKLQNIGGTLQVYQIQDGDANEILMTNAGGNGVTWGNASVLAQGDLTSNDLTITNGTSSILNDVQLEIGQEVITSDNIKDGEVANADLGTDAVTSDKIKDGEVKATDLGAEPADAGKVPTVQSDGTVIYETPSTDATNVTNAKTLSNTDGSITVTDGTGATLVDAQVKVADGGITNTKLASDAVTSDKILDGEVKNGDLAADAVTSDKIKDGEVNTGDLANSAVTTDKIQGGGNDMVLITDNTGNPIWVDKNTLVQSNETITTLEKNSNGTYTYTSEDGTATTIDTTSAGYSIYDDTNSGLNADNTQDAIDSLAGRLANTSDTLKIAGGHVTHIAVDGTKTEFDITQSGSGDPITNGTTGAAGDVYVDESTGDVYTYNSTTNTWEIANPETVTTLEMNAGTLEYANEDASNANVPLISADANNAITAGTDGALFVADSLAKNIYNSDGTLTGARSVFGTENWLMFYGDNGSIQLNGNDLRSANTTGGVTDLYYNGNTARLHVQGTSDALEIGTHATDNPAPITFVTSPGGTGSSVERMRITGTGDIGIGTQTPTELLDVDGGNVRIRDINASTGTSTDKIVVADADGVLKTVDAADLATTTATADNGLTKTSNNIQLGGDLTKPTTITADATNTLAVKGLQDGAVTDSVVVVDANGVLKKLKAVMPKFFYMPSIVMPTAASQLGTVPYSGTASDPITESGGTFTVNLHAIYNAQFGLSGTNSVSSAGAGHTLPTLGAADLIYNITYYDSEVFTNVSVDANGVLTYQIAPGAVVDVASFMNVVFEVK